MKSSRSWRLILALKDRQQPRPGTTFGPGWCLEPGPKACFGKPRRKCACGLLVVLGGSTTRDKWGLCFILAPKLLTISFFFHFFFICLLRMGYQLLILLKIIYGFKNYETKFLDLFIFDMSSKNILFLFKWLDPWFI